MPSFVGTSLHRTPTPSIAVAGGTRVPGPELAGSSSTNPKVKSAALRGILQMSPVRLTGAPTCLSGHLQRHLGSPLGGQFHGRAAHGPPLPLRPCRAGGAGGETLRLSAFNAEAVSAIQAPWPLIHPSGCPLRTAVPNLSFNRSSNGRPPGPVRRYAVHCLRPGPGVQPSSPG
jgi:hypothetical protein